MIAALWWLTAPPTTTPPTTVPPTSMPPCDEFCSTVTDAVSLMPAGLVLLFALVMVGTARLVLSVLR